MRAKTSPQRVVLRSRIYLLAAEGLPNNAMAHRWETSRPPVLLWRTRFNEAGPSGLPEDAPHGPAPTACRPEKSEPAWHGSRTHTACPPHRIETFKRSKDTRCVETLTDVVGMDEQPQVHALDRTHPGVPMKKGRCGPLTHDDKPHGTTGLFAAPSPRGVAEFPARHRPRHVARAGPPLDPGQ